MIDLRIGSEPVERPFMVRVYDVDDDTFDRLVDEDTKAELLEGVMIVHSPASIEHEEVSVFIRSLMKFYADARELGTVLGPNALTQLGPRRRVAPDVFFVRRERWPSGRPKQFLGAPDLVVEVLSPSNRDYDLIDKRCAYRESGVGEVWFVDTDRDAVIVEVRGPAGVEERVLTTGRLESTVLTGFWLEVDWLWSERLPSAPACLEQILGGK